MEQLADLIAQEIDLREELGALKNQLENVLLVAYARHKNGVFYRVFQDEQLHQTVQLMDAYEKERERLHGRYQEYPKCEEKIKAQWKGFAGNTAAVKALETLIEAGLMAQNIGGGYIVTEEGAELLEEHFCGQNIRGVPVRNKSEIQQWKEQYEAPQPVPRHLNMSQMTADELAHFRARKWCD